MELKLTDKEKKAIEFIQDFFDENNREKMIIFLLRKGIQAISEGMTNLSPDQKEFLNIFTNKKNVQSAAINK